MNFINLKNNINSSKYMMVICLYVSLITHAYYYPKGRGENTVIMSVCLLACTHIILSSSLVIYFFCICHSENFLLYYVLITVEFTN